MGADFRRADGAFENAGDLGKREFLKAREQQHLAIVAIEAGERGLEQGVVVTGDRGVRGMRRFVCVLVQILRIDGMRRGACFAEVVGGAAAREVIHPSGEAPVVPVGVAVFEHSLKHRLCDILGRGPIAGVFQEKTEERAMVALEKFTKRVEVTVADGEHQRVIGALFSSGVQEGGARFFNHGWTGMNTDFFEGGNHGGGRAWMVLLT